MSAGLEDGLAAAEASGDEVLITRGLTSKGVLMAWAGRPVEASALFTFALETARRSGNTAALINAWGNLSDHLLTSDVPKALVTAREGAAQARRLGQRLLLQTLLSNLWLGMLFAGEWDDVERQTADQPQEHDFGDIHIRRALLLAWRGDTDAALHEVELTRAFFSESDVQEREMIKAATATIRVLEGRFRDALEEALPVIDNDAGLRREACRVALPAALEAALQEGDLDAVDRMLDKVDGRGPGDAPPFLRAQLARFRARARWARGDRGRETEADLRSAVSQLDELGYPYWSALARYDLATVLADAGEVGGAAREAAKVVEAATALGAVPLAGQAQVLGDRLPSAVTA